jgi:RHS repeat-associated protein
MPAMKPTVSAWRLAPQMQAKERDSESGLDYFGKRYYGSWMGRWLSPDLVNVTEERMMNPSSTLNKYAYAANNPLKYVDPDGQDITYFYDPGGSGIGFRS